MSGSAGNAAPPATSPVPSAVGGRPGGFTGQVAVVTGASRGLGAATAVDLARHGAAVACLARDRAALDGVVGGIHAAGGRAIAVPVDCTDQAALHRAREAVRAELGPVNVLVAFAGGNGTPTATGSETAAHWRAVLDGDLTSVFLTIAAFLPDLTARRGVIVTMASESARHTTGASAAYAAAKGGVIALTRHLAGELAPAGIRINCLCPATIATDMLTARVPPDRLAAMAATYPLGRLGQPADVTALTRFLASPDSAWITGETIDLAGGRPPT